MWQLSGTIGKWDCGGIRTSVDASHPERGFLCSASNGRFLQLLIGDEKSPLRLELVEAYVRGSDLIANYAPLQRQAIQPQIYWRARESQKHRAVGVEFIVSMQTSLLDSNPETVLATGMPTGDIYDLGDPERESLTPLEGQRLPVTLSAGDNTARPSLFGFQPRDTGYAYVEMVHQADFVATTVEVNRWGEPWMTTRLFTERLEKGVIRRARVCGWHIPRDCDVLAAARELYRDFAAEPLPLTT